MNNRLRNYSLFIFNYSLLIVLLSGCGKKLPDGIPKLYPAKIRVTQDNVPLDNALVSLTLSEGTTEYPAVGTTGADGIAKLKTNGLYYGIVPGKYKVSVIKQELEKLPNPYEGAPDAKTEPDAYYVWNEKNQEKIAKMQKVPRVYHIVNPKYNMPETTPLEIEITAGKTDYEVDAGKAVKIEDKDKR